MSQVQITIVGLGLIGASMGLALKRHEGKQPLVIVGHDKEPDAASRAQKMKAVDRTEWNLVRAVERADVVILALPVSEISPTLQAIGDALRPGTLVTDTASIKTPVLQAASAYLPAGVHFVGGHPIISRGGLDEELPSATLFSGCVYCLSVQPDTDPNAVQVAADLVSRIGATPLFLAADEHDGLIALTENIPVLVAGALLATLQRGAWGESRQLAGRQLKWATHIESQHAGAFAQSVVANADNVLRGLDALRDELNAWRVLIANGDVNALEAAFEEAIAARHAWLTGQTSAVSENTNSNASARSVLSRFFGFRR